MNPNAYALLLEQVYTVDVIFNDGGKWYSYLSTTKPSVGDQCLVSVSGQVKLVDVVEVTDGINPSEPRELKWIIGAVDFTAYDAHMGTVKMLKDKVGEIYNKSAQKRMREVLLAELGVSSVTELIANEGVKNAAN